MKNLFLLLILASCFENLPAQYQIMPPLDVQGNLRVSRSGKIVVGGSTAATSCLLDIQSTTKGAKFPAMTAAQRLAISSPTPGTMVFDTDSDTYCVSDGVGWKCFGASTFSGNVNEVVNFLDSVYLTLSVYVAGTGQTVVRNPTTKVLEVDSDCCELAHGSWQITGNAGTSYPTNFIGTTDANPLTVKSNNLVQGLFQGSTREIAFGDFLGLNNSTQILLSDSNETIQIGGNTAIGTNYFLGAVNKFTVIPFDNTPTSIPVLQNDGSDIDTLKKMTVADFKTLLDIPVAPSGRYMPTISDTVDVNILTLDSFFWSVNGDVVTVNGMFTFQSPSMTVGYFELSLPIASDLTDEWKFNTGDGISQIVITNEGVRPDLVDNTARVGLNNNGSTETYKIHFTYIIE